MNNSFKKISIAFFIIALVILSTGMVSAASGDAAKASARQAASGQSPMGFTQANEAGVDIVAYALASLSNALGSLLSGDLPMFFEHLFHSLPLFAVFLSVFALFWWLGSITLFRKSEHKKFAILFAIGLTLGAVWEGTIFSIILSLTPTVLWILFAFILVFMFVILYRRLRTESHKSASKMYDAMNDEDASRGKRKKWHQHIGANMGDAKKSDNLEQNQLGQERKTTKEEGSEEKTVEDMFANEKKLDALLRNIYATVEKLAQSKEPAPQEVAQLKAMINSLSLAKKEDKHINADFTRLERLFHKHFRAEKGELGNIRKIIKHQDHLKKDPQAKPIVEQIIRDMRMEGRDIAQIERELKQSESDVKKGVGLSKKIKADLDTILQELENIEKEIKEHPSKHPLTTVKSKILSLLQQTETEVKELEQISIQINNLLHNIEKLDSQVKQINSNAYRGIKKEEGVEKKEMKSSKK